MTNIMLGIGATLLTIYLTPILIYGIFSKIFGINPPGEVSPFRFLLSIFISKLGTAIAMTLLFSLTKSFSLDSWLLYSLVWWLMFVTGEIGQWLGGSYSRKEAIAGIISETIYVPLSVFFLTLILH